MPSTFTNNGGIELPADGEKDGVWGDVVNLNMQIIDRLTNGVGAVSLTGTTSTLVTSDGTLSGDGQYKVIVFGGSPSGTHTVTIQPDDAQKVYFVKNETAEDVVITQGSGGNATITAGSGAIVYANGVGTGSAVVDLTGNIDGRDISVDGAKLDTIEPNADVTDTANVTAAGALMDSEVDADIKTLTLPASTTISTYGATLVDDISASAARATLGSVIGTDVQAYDAGLTSIATLTPPTGSMLYTTGSNTYAAASYDGIRDLLGVGGISGNGAGIEIGSDETGNRSCFLDLHSSDGVDFNARIIRDPGVNGELDIQQNGTGEININTGGGPVRTNQTPGATENNNKIATTSFVQAAIALKAIGEAQTWQGVGRSANVWYQNTSTRPIVFQMISNATGNLHIDVGPSTASYGSQTWGDLSSGTYDAASTIVPSGHFYRARGSGMAINVAAELR